MFILTENQKTYVAISRIARAHAVADRYGGTVLEMYDDEGKHLGRAGIRTFERATQAPLIPAQPGTMLLQYWEAREYPDGELKHWVSRDAVIGFGMGVNDELVPITLEGTPERWAVLFPDGRVEAPHEADFDSVDKYVEWMRAEMESERRAEAAIAAHKAAKAAEKSASPSLQTLQTSS